MRIALFLVMALPLSQAAWAQIYQWRDGQGRLPFGDRPASHLKAEPVATVSASAKREFVDYGGRGVPLLLLGTARGTETLRRFSEDRFGSLYHSP